MSRHALCLNLLVILAALNRGTVEAQFYYASPGSTVQGDILHGWGAASIGMGMYNFNTAVAQSIVADAWMRRNQYFYEASREQIRRQAVLESQRRARKLDASNENQARVVDHPEPRDIYRGDSLNTLARLVAGMNVHPSAARATRVGVPGGTLQSLPLVHAPTQTVISVARLDVKGQWPLLLRDPVFATARGRYERALDSVHTDLLDRRLSSRTLDELDRSVSSLMVQCRSVEGSANRIEVSQARTFLTQLSRSTEMLRDPAVENAFSAVVNYLGTSVADLLAFMQQHDLRFAPAAGPHEKELFEDLYALVAEHRQKLIAAVVIQ